MKKIFLMALLAAQVFVASAQTTDTKPYEEKMAGYETEFKTLVENYNQIQQKGSAALTEADKAKLSEIEKKAEEISQRYLETTLEVAEKFKDTKFPAKYIAENFYSMSYEQLEKVLDPKSGYYNEPELKQVKDYFASLSLRRPGLMYTDLEMKDMKDKTVKLSQWVGKGKYVFVDFWASWCGPCRQEMPNVVEAYAKYKDKGLEIIGVSFDSKKEAWVAGVEKLNMTWPQMSDLKGWKSAATEAYGVRSIPSNVLLDPSGKIIAHDLRAEELQKVLADLFK